jgi:hypothetical protein
LPIAAKAYIHRRMAKAARRWGAGTSAIVRALVAAAGPVSQVELATMVGVSQPRVSQVLAHLGRLSAVSTRATGYVGRKATLIDLYLAHHRPGQATSEMPWYSVRPLRAQVDELCALAGRRSVSCAVSADLAPDLLAPWRHPTLTVVYTDAALALEDAGFVPAEGRADATVLVRHTSDPTLLVASGLWVESVEGLPLTDPLQQMWDLHDLGGGDRREAADRLRRAILHDPAALTHD